jgi:hypothetical protein
MRGSLRLALLLVLVTCLPLLATAQPIATPTSRSTAAGPLFALISRARRLSKRDILKSLGLVSTCEQKTVKTTTTVSEVYVDPATGEEISDPNETTPARRSLPLFWPVRARRRSPNAASAPLRS